MSNDEPRSDDASPVTALFDALVNRAFLFGGRVGQPTINYDEFGRRSLCDCQQQII